LFRDRFIQIRQRLCSEKARSSFSRLSTSQSRWLAPGDRIVKKQQLTARVADAPSPKSARGVQAHLEDYVQGMPAMASILGWDLLIAFLVLMVVGCRDSAAGSVDAGPVSPAFDRSR
jgi:hypothetical protein